MLANGFGDSQRTMSPPMGEEAYDDFPYPVYADSEPPIEDAAIFRKINSALGGPYNELFNYRREVIGRLSRPYFPKDRVMRCQLCFAKSSLTFDVGCTRRWGIVWCDPCLKQYSISYAQVCALFQSDEVLYYLSLMSYQHRGTNYYYRPAVDNVVARKGGPTLQDINLAMRFCEVEHHRRLAGSQLEKKRREIRLLIVNLAQYLWEGIDPFPDTETTADGNVVETPRPKYSDPQRFKCFRERFCPTSTLPKMLFPSLSLTGIPSDEDYKIKDGGWLPDPAVVIVRRAFAIHYNMREFLDVADMMLNRLTDYANPGFYHNSRGGYVRAWVDGAMKYHTNRIEAEIESGAIVHLEGVPEYAQYDVKYGNLHTLRRGLGLENPLTGDFIAPSLRRPNLAQRTSSDDHTLMKADAAALAQQNQHKDKIKAFNKIIKADCVSCPSGSGMFNPRGLEGLAHHMRVCHAYMFWETDDFTTVG